MILWTLACSAPADPADLADSAPVHDSAAPAPTRQIESAEACGACHPTHYDEWRQSMHAYAAQSPVFDAMAAKVYRDTAGGVGSFCTDCHSSQGSLQGDPGHLDASGRSELALEGISCDGCHTAVTHEHPIGNARIEHDIEGPKRGPVTDPADATHDSEASDFVTSPELCGSCHDVFSYPGLLIEQAYTEYLESPAREAGVRCQDCHMGPVPGLPAERARGPIAVVEGIAYEDRELSSHRFVGPDYSLLDSFPYPDDPAAGEAARAEYRQQVEVLLGNAVELRDAEVVVKVEGVTLSVDLASLTDGHRVPTGFTSERQLWLEATLTDAKGEVVFVTGDLDADGNLRDAHSPLVAAGEVPLDTDLVNLQSLNLAEVINEHGDTALGSAQVEVTFPHEADNIYRRSLEPGEVRALEWVAEGSFEQPVTARFQLHFRNLPPYVLHHLQLDDLVDRLQIVTIDDVEVVAP